MRTNTSSRRALAVCLAAALGTGCGDAPGAATLFERLPPERTGISFENELPEDPSFNILNYLNYYNGAGVAAGDVDGDGRPDLYFASNLGSNRLYRNLGGYRFEDITERAGVAGSDGWTTGVAMADVNGDGHLDLYVSAVTYLDMRGHNILYVNRGDGTFADETEAYGLGHEGYGTQAAFFDYDLDGDLDAYLLNHSVHAERGDSFRPQRDVVHPRSGDRLLRNDGNRFVDVTTDAGIHAGVEGYGLGIVVSDLDLDGCPDIYVANDFQEDDFLYFNRCDGTFEESVDPAMGHTSLSSMGVDAADFDNDGRPDVAVLDMLPWREDILKTSAAAESFEIERRKLAAGYHPQYARNTLQWNRGGRRFSDIAFLAGVAATDWSWSPLFADLDDDGDKDLLVTNGIYRRPNDLDYIARVGDPAVQAALAAGDPEETLRLIRSMPHVAIPNRAFRNDGGLRFSDAAAEWGLAEPGFSTGAVYVDLDGSGSLDLVLSELGAPAAVYRNRGSELTGNRSLTVRLEGEGANSAGIGAKVTVVQGTTRQVVEQMPTRGFLSSVDPRLHIGLGTAETVDSLIVVWPDRRVEARAGVPAGGVTLRQADASDPAETPERVPSPGFADVTRAVGIVAMHEENPFFDLRTQPLMPREVSAEGPALAVGDVDGNGLDDVFLGGAKHRPGQLLLQRPDGTFAARVPSAFGADSLHEDVAAAFLDVDGDGALDLYVGSGGNEFWGEHEALRDRLYMGDGRGGFRRAGDRLPDAFENTSTVAPTDFDGDGHPDLFVGGRVVSREYGRPPRSRLLLNDGTGRFRDVTAERAPELERAGMVTSAVWLDRGAGAPELVVVGDWMPVRVFRPEGDRLVDRSAEAGLSETEGWWNRVAAVDLNADGVQDLVLGNLGLNSYVRAAPATPARLYVGDFGRDGRLEQILTFYGDDGASHPLASRDELLAALPFLRDRFPTYADFGARSIEDLLPEAELARAEVLEAKTLASAVALGSADGSFRLAPLPIEAQIAPLYAAIADDFDADGHVDLVVAGNAHDVPPVQGRYDAGLGLFLRGDGTGALTAVDPATSGLTIEGSVRDMRFVTGADGARLIVVARNDGPLEVLQPRP